MSDFTENLAEDISISQTIFAAVQSTDLDSLSEKSGPLPASEASIDAMPRVQVTEGGKGCAICLEEFEIGSEAREMPCKHGFHSGCIENWLKIHGSCPICRFVMPVKEQEEESEGDQIEVWELILNRLLDRVGMDMDSDTGRNQTEDYSDSYQRQSRADSGVDGSSPVMDMDTDMDMDFLSELLDMDLHSNTGLCPDEDELEWDELCGLIHG